MWLPEDVSWTKDKPGIKYAAALNSLHLYHRDLVDCEWKRTPRGRAYLSFRLTALGIEARRTADGEGEG
jgi:predicted ArsR family transcriptional regulator